MRQIAYLLEKFKNLKAPNKFVEEETKKIIKELFKKEDDCYKVVFKKPYLTIISNNPVFKSEVFLKKDKIIEKLKTKLNKDRGAQLKILFK